VGMATFGHGRKATGEEAGRLGFIKVDHFTARPTLSITRPDPTTGVSATEIYSVMAAGDPQIHTHTIVPNVLVTESGRILSIDTKRIAGRIHEFGAIYQGVLGAKLEALGVSTDLDPRTKMLRLTAIPEDVVQAFSKRTTQGEGAAEEYAQQHGLVWSNMPTDQRVAMLKAALKERREGKGDDLANIAS
jgi:conjugative relaxase-like TrwC/TraI family protein